MTPSHTHLAEPPGLPAASHGDEAFRAAVSLHQAGQVEAAAQAYEALLERSPGHAGAWHLLGVSRHQQGQPEVGADCIARALVIDGSRAVYHNNYGVALRALGRSEEARAAFERAVVLQPQYADAHSNLGLVLADRGDGHGAIACFRRALELAPRHADALFNLANLLHALGRSPEAAALYQRLIRIDPGRSAAFNNLGNALMAQRRAAEAAGCYERALALAPGFAEAALNLGTAYAEQERLPDAGRAFAAAARLRRDKPLWQLRHLGLCPAVFQSVEEIDAYRVELEGRLDAALQSAPFQVAEADLAADALVPPFNLAHHGRCNRRLLEKFAALFAPHVRPRRPRPRGGKPRVGFAVTAPHVKSFLRVVGGVVERLDPRRFQVVVLAPERALGELRQSLRREGAEWVGFPERFDRAADAIAAAGCDVLYYHKVSADPLGYLLPFARLAPVQCTTWPTHHTSGVPQVDYYLSSALVEADGAQADYTERLVRLAALPSYERRLPEIPPARRSDFGLPERGGLYLCPQRLAKFHPAHDELLRGVLEADPEGHLVLVADGASVALRQLRERFARTLGPHAGRVIVLPGQSPAEFRRLLSVGDVLLDLPHYSVSLMAYDALAAGLPVVTLPGRLQVERYALGFYRRLGLRGAVAASPADYVALAARFGTDADYRQAFRDRLAERLDLLFEDAQTVREYEWFFEEALCRGEPAWRPSGDRRPSDGPPGG